MKVIEMTKNKVLIAGLMLGTVASVTTGCKPRDPVLPPPLGDLTGPLKREFDTAGKVAVYAGTKSTTLKMTKEELIKNSHVVFRSRRNPFAMFAEELSFQSGIRYGQILSKIPGFANVLPAPAEPPPPELREPEPQPYRRLSGVYFGDTVSAIIEMGDGNTYVVSPGQRVGDTEWYVESIDSEKVVLVRYTNKDPKRVVVRLETPPFGGGSGGGGGFGGGDNNPGGGGGGGKLGNRGGGG